MLAKSESPVFYGKHPIHPLFLGFQPSQIGGSDFAGNHPPATIRRQPNHRPAVYPHDNTWSIFAMKDITVEFVHVMTGAAWAVR